MLNPNTVFFITGGANGIGRATAELVVARGHRVVIADIDQVAAQGAGKALGLKALVLTLDVRRAETWPGALEAAQAHFGKIDVLVNNAGVMHTGFFIDQSDDAIREMMEVNFWGLACGLRAGTAFFKEQGFGHLVTIGSMASFVSLKGQSFYSATKHAVRSLHYGFAQELENPAIRFSIIHPGSVETRMLAKQVGEEAAVLSFAEPTLQPETVAKAVYRAVEGGIPEILIPAGKGFFSRFVGIFPGFLARALGGQWERGRTKMLERVRGGK
jgi:NAD(P)-dependent dehydrogenase (short-subunit alcohol dehydrogenase family)